MTIRQRAGQLRDRLGIDAWDANRWLIVISAASVALLLLWAAIARVDEVTRGMGKVIPSSKVQSVQAAEPSTVAAILVRPGQLVRKGELLVRLDDVQSSSALGQLETENSRLTARAARLEQEGTGAGPDCSEGGACEDEARLAEARRATTRSREGALAAAIEQRRRDLSEGQATVASLEGSAGLAQQQVEMLAPLAARKIVPQTELLTAQRELVDVRGRLAAARQGVARAQAAIREAQAQYSEAQLEFRQQALSERSEVATKIAVNEQSIRGASARVERNELRAPASGFVNDVQVTTVGGFVNAGERIMQIVPVGDKLLVEARVTPRDIAFIKVGDAAVVKVTAYDFATYGGLTGTVKTISADSIYDQAERQAYYTVLVETDRAYIARRGIRLPIMPGMICDVEIVTGRKSILSYLMTPITRAFDDALRER